MTLKILITMFILKKKFEIVRFGKHYILYYDYTMELVGMFVRNCKN